jgi:hypothetical protein
MLRVQTRHLLRVVFVPQNICQLSVGNATRGILTTSHPRGLAAGVGGGDGEGYAGWGTACEGLVGACECVGVACGGGGDGILNDSFYGIILELLATLFGIYRKYRNIDSFGCD